MKQKLTIFITILKMELKLYIHSWWVWGMFLTLCLYLLSGYFVFFIENNSYGQLLQSSAFIIMGGILLGIFSGMFFSQRERKVKFEEVMQTYLSHYIFLLAKLIGWFFIVCIFVIISIVAMLSAYLSVGSQLILFWKMTIAYIIIYWGLPFLAAGFIGYALDKLMHLPWKYVIAFLIWAFTSPFNTYLPKKIAFLFNQGQENPQACYDYFRGLNISIEVVLRHLFFLLTAVVFVLLALLMKYQLKKKQRISILIIMLALILFGSSIIPFANHKTDFDACKLFILYDEDDAFYKEYQNGETLQYEQSFYDFQVKEYHINLTHDEETISYSANIEVFIPENKEVNRLEFSLYHGLKVLDINLDGENLRWKQEGDWLLIDWDPKMRQGTFSIEVCGTTGYKNPIGKNTFFLSSSFAWYPIPGKYKFADKMPLWDLQFRNLTHSYPTNFNIQVNKKEKVFSNLSEVGHNQFQGQDYGATLVFGQLLKSEINGITIIAPPDMDTAANQVLNHIKDTVQSINQNIQVNREVNPQFIFVVPIEMNNKLNAFPIEYTCNQLFICAHFLSIYGGNIYFAREDFVLPCIYWFNQYRSADNRVPILLTCLYNKLYVNPKKAWYTFDRMLEEKEYYQADPRDIKLYEISQTVLALYDKGYTEELKTFLNQCFILADKNELDLDLLEQLVEAIELKLSN